MSLCAVENLEARHGLLVAVRGITLGVNEGETLALVGANGAGKTTLMRTIAGAHKPYSGTIIFDGRDVTALPAHKRVGLGIALVPEGRRLFTGMTVEENLRVAGAHGRKGNWNLESVLAAFPQLKPKLKSKAGDLSGGAAAGDGDRARADDQSAAVAAGRGVSGAVAAGGRPGL